MLRRRFTKWIPFGNYNWDNNTDYIVFVRRNIKTGMMQFKTKRVHGLFVSKSAFVPKLIDVIEAWDTIIKTNGN